MRAGTRASHQVTGTAFAVGGAIAFGTLPIFAKRAYEVGADPVALLGLRFATAALVLAAANRIAGRSLAVGRRNAVRLLLLGAIAYGFESSLYFFALKYAGAGVVGLIFYSYPLWTNVIGFATGLERFTPRIAIALALGSAGVVSIFTVASGDLLGPILALCAAVSVAFYMVVAQVVTRGVPAAASATYTAAGAALSCALGAVALGADLPAGAVVHGGALGLVTSIAFLCMYTAIARIGSARTAIANMTEPVTTVALAAVFLGEAITLRIALGAALVISSLPVLVAAPPRGEAAPSADSA